jgi:hypothetical protein
MYYYFGKDCFPLVNCKKVNCFLLIFKDVFPDIEILLITIIGHFFMSDLFNIVIAIFVKQKCLSKREGM